MELIVTIDTEPDCDTAWRRSVPLSFSSVTEGIPLLLRPLWDRYGVRPLYFVSPEVARDDECCRVLAHERDRGAVIGSHLHSEFIEPGIAQKAEGIVSAEFPCYAHGYEMEKAKIRNLTDLIEARIGVRPIWYRAARFGADVDTIRILAELGYRYDSSVTPGIDWSRIGGPDHRRAPAQPYWIDPTDLYRPAPSAQESAGIKEYPVTISGKRFGVLGNMLPDHWLLYRWLRPTHMTLIEQKRMVKRMKDIEPPPTLVLMFHSMEIMIGKTPFVRNRWMQKRFLSNLEGVISFITSMGGDASSWHHSALASH